MTTSATAADASSLRVLAAAEMDAVAGGLNPQPLPPRWSWVMLNPQPLPPRWSYFSLLRLFR